MKKETTYQLTILFCWVKATTLVLGKSAAGEIARALHLSWPAEHLTRNMGPLRFEFSRLGPADDSQL